MEVGWGGREHVLNNKLLFRNGRARTQTEEQGTLTSEVLKLVVMLTLSHYMELISMFFSYVQLQFRLKSHLFASCICFYLEGT